MTENLQDEIVGLIELFLEGKVQSQNLNQLKMDFNLVVDGNLDSLDLVTLYFDLEDRFGVAIEETDISESELHRIGNLVDYITSRTPD